MPAQPEVRKLTREAERSANNGDLKDAERLTDQALRLDPEDPVALRVRARVLRLGGDHGSAEKIIEQAMMLHSSSAALIEERGWLRFDRGLYGQAIDDWIKFLPHSSVKKVTAQLNSLLTVGPEGGARRLARAAVARFGSDAMVREAAGWLLLALGDVSQAIEYWTGATNVSEDVIENRLYILASEPASPELDAYVLEELAKTSPVGQLLSSGARYFEKRGDSDAVERIFQVLPADSELREDAFERTVRAHLGAGKPDKALSLSNIALSAFPDNAAILSLKAHALVKLGILADAIVVLKSFGSLDENAAAFAAELRANGESETARAILQLASAKLNRHPHISAESAQLSLDRGDFKSAHRQCDAALSTVTSELLREWLKMFERGLASDEASDLVEKAVRGARTPEDRTGFRSLRAHVWLARGEPERAATEWIALVGELGEYEITDASYALRVERAYAESLRLVEAALLHRPRSVPLYLERGWNRMDKRDYSGAIQDFDTALKFEPDDYSARMWKMTCVRLLGRPREAVNVLTPMIEEEPYRFLRLLLNERAAAWLAVDDQTIDTAAVERAGRDYDRARELKDDDSDAINGQAQVRIRLNRTADAIHILRDALERYPENDSVRPELGFLYIRLYENDAAKREFELIRDEKNIERLNGLAVVDFREGYYARAEVGFRAVLELRPDHPVLLTNVAWALTLQVQDAVIGLDTPTMRVNSKRLQDAEDLCAVAKVKDPNYSGVYGCLGAIAVKRGQVEQAESYFRKSIELSKRDGSHVELAALYIQQGRLDEADAALKAAFAANSHDVGALLERGKLQIERKETANAIRSFQHALLTDPWNEEAARALARAYEDESRLADAEKVLSDQIGKLKNPVRKGRARLALARVLVKIGDVTEQKHLYEEAMTLVMAAINSGDNDADARYHRAVIAFKLEDRDQALAEFKKCTSSNPEALRHIALLSRLPSRTEAALRSRVLPYIALVQAIAVWQAFVEGLINQYLFSSMELAFAALLAVAVMMPRLSRFKLAGLEADVGAPTESLTLTRRPEIGFSSVPRGSSATPR